VIKAIIERKKGIGKYIGSERKKNGVKK